MKRKVIPAVLAVLCLTPLEIRAQSPAERTQFGHEIVVEPGQVSSGVTCVGCSIHVLGTVQGDAVAVGGAVEVKGTVQGDSVAVGGSVEVTGMVQGDAVAVGGSTKLGPGARVGGDAVAVVGRVQRNPQATVGGEVTSFGGLPVTGLATLVLLGLLLSLAVNFVLVIVCYLIEGERRLETMAATVRERGGMTFLVGLAAMLAAAIVMGISFLIGRAAIAIVCSLVGLALFITLVVGYTGLSLWLGRLVSRGSKPLVAVLIGLVLLHVVQAVPLLGFIAVPAFFLLALGSAVLTGYGNGPDWLQRGPSLPRAAPPVAPPTT